MTESTYDFQDWPDSRSPEFRAEYDRRLATRLVELRNIFGLDVKAAAARANVSSRSWRKWEAQAVHMRTEPFLKICRTFKCSCDWLSGCDGTYPVQKIKPA